jgi:multidrug resistance efflux pump
MFRARATLARANEDLRQAESQVVAKRADLEQCQRALGDIERKVQELAERAAGVTSVSHDDEVMPRKHSEFVPVRR